MRARLRSTHAWALAQRRAGVAHTEGLLDGLQPVAVNLYSARWPLSAAGSSLAAPWRELRGVPFFGAAIGEQIAAHFSSVTVDERDIGIE